VTVAIGCSQGGIGDEQWRLGRQFDPDAARPELGMVAVVAYGQTVSQFTLDILARQGRNEVVGVVKVARGALWLRLSLVAWLRTLLSTVLSLLAVGRCYWLYTVLVLTPWAGLRRSSLGWLPCLTRMPHPCGLIVCHLAFNLQSVQLLNWQPLQVSTECRLRVDRQLMAAFSGGHLHQQLFALFHSTDHQFALAHITHGYFPHVMAGRIFPA
jgi:hypothetical protein